LSVAAHAFPQAVDGSFDKRVADAAALYKSGKADEAQAAFEKLYAESPHSYDVQSWLGFLYLRNNEAAKAVPLLEQASTQRPTDVEVLNNLGNAYMATKQEDRALEKYRAIAKLSPRMFEPHYNSGTIYLGRKQYPQAIAEFQAAARLNGDDPFVHNNLGVAYEARREYDRAAGEFVRAAELRPENRVFARNAGLALARLRKPEAVPYLEKALGDGSDSAVALALGEAYARAGRREAALQYYESLRNVESKNPTFWFNLAVLRGAMNNPQGAEQAYRRVLELSPNDLDALNNLGLLLFRAKKYEEATVLFDKLAGLNPSSISAKVNLGSAAVNAGQTGKAVAAWKEVIKAEPGRTPIRLQLANALWELGDVEGARYHYLQILGRDKNHPEALNGIGLSHLRAGKLPQAEAAFRSAIEAKPTYVAAHNNLAITLERMGQRAEAIKILEKALKIAPDDPDVRANLERMRSSG
jgi:superkiller protein 3